MNLNEIDFSESDSETISSDDLDVEDPALHAQLEEFKKSVEDIGSQIQALTKGGANSYKQMIKGMEPEERAKTHLMSSYIVNSLYYLLLRSSGEEISKDHPVIKELERVNDYERKLQEALKEARK